MTREERIKQLKSEIEFNKLLRSVHQNSDAYKKENGIKPRIMGKLKVIR